MRDRMIVRVAVGVAASCLVILAAIGPEPATDEDYGRSTTCQEDEACWDCATMGNRICGMP